MATQCQPIVLPMHASRQSVPSLWPVLSRTNANARPEPDGESSPLEEEGREDDTRSEARPRLYEAVREGQVGLRDAIAIDVDVVCVSMSAACLLLACPSIARPPAPCGRGYPPSCRVWAWMPWCCLYVGRWMLCIYYMADELLVRDGKRVQYCAGVSSKLWL